jgi:hypothetical protein
MIDSADARWHCEQAARLVAFMPLVRSAMVRVNLPAANLTDESITSPGLTRKTLTDPFGNISYQAT